MEEEISELPEVEEEVTEEVPAEVPAEEKEKPVKKKRFSKKKAWLLAIVGIVVVLGLLTWRLQWYQKALDHYNADTVTLKVREGDKFVLTGAKILLNGTTYTTDQNGKVTVTSIVAGIYTLKITKDGYSDASQKISLHRGDNDLQLLSLTK